MESLQELTEEKARQDTQLAALGSNLASVRQQLEGERRRGMEMEKRGKSQENRIEGMYAQESVVPSQQEDIVPLNCVSLSYSCCWSLYT